MGEIKGPLGMWSFPLLTMLMSVFQGGTEPAKKSLSPIVTNDETWRWTDYKGRKRELTIQREVKG